MRTHLFLACCLLACSSSTVTPSNESDADVDVPPSPCTGGGSECGPNGFCDAKSCGAAGTCAPRPPASAGAEFGTVCGCNNGITYWSAAWANAQGTIGVQGTCDGPTIGSHAPAMKCATDADCGGVSARCVAIGCDGSGEKTCWSLPPSTTCPTEAMPLRGWETCDGASKCLTECEALETGRPFDTGAICH